MGTKAIQSEHKQALNHLHVCRLCLSEELLEDIFKCDDLNVWISNFLSIMVSENDKISRSICALCRARLNEFRDFQMRCFDVQDVLQGESSMLFHEDPSLSETEEAKPSSEVHPELTIDAREYLPPTIPDLENKTEDVEKLPVRFTKRVFKIKSRQKQGFNDEKDAYQTQKLECTTCGEKVYKYRMEGHQNRHKGVRPYKCELGCENMDFHSRQNQLIHQREIHSVQRYECDSCNKVFCAKRNLRIHKVNVHSPKNFLCCICNIQLATSLGFNRHMQRMHDPNRKRKLPCPYCNCSYDKNVYLQKHLMQMHLVEMLETSKKIRKRKTVAKLDSLEAPKVKIEPDVDSMETKDELQDDSYAEVEGHLALFEAEEAKIEPDSNPEQEQDHFTTDAEDGSAEPVILDQTVVIKSELQTTFQDADVQKSQDHKKRKGKVRSRRINITETREKRKVYYSKERYQQQKIKCPDCDKKIHPPDMPGHLNKHKGIQPFKCELGCKKMRFFCIKKRHTHYRFIHNAQQQECTICHKSYPSKASLSNHKRNVHSVRKYDCSLCDTKPFTTISRLNQHLKLHNRDDKKYSCSTCSSSFSLKRELDYHRKMHLQD